MDTGSRDLELPSDWCRVRDPEELGGVNTNYGSDLRKLVVTVQEAGQSRDLHLVAKVSCGWWSRGHVTTVLTSDWLVAAGGAAELGCLGQRLVQRLHLLPRGVLVLHGAARAQPAGHRGPGGQPRGSGAQVSGDWWRRGHVITVLTSDWSPGSTSPTATTRTTTWRGASSASPRRRASS